MSKQFPGTTTVKYEKGSGVYFICLNQSGALIQIKRKDLNPNGHLEGHETGIWYFTTFYDPKYQHGFRTLKEAKKKAQEILETHWITGNVYA